MFTGFMSAKEMLLEVAKKIPRAATLILLGVSIVGFLACIVAGIFYCSIPFMVVGILCGASMVWLQQQTERDRAIRHMSAHPALSNTEFGQHYFNPDRTDIAARTRKILQRHNDVDLARLHPDDRLVEDIRMDELDSLSTVEFVIEIEKEFGIRISDADATKMRSLRDVVDYVADAKKKIST
jgi:acyl carrier protein